MSGFFKRLALWTVICVISAAPSFFCGLLLNDEAYHVAGMLTGVAIFILAYTWVTGLSWFRRLRRAHLMKPTLYTGYGIRLGLSIIFPIGFYADMVVGIASTSVVGVVLRDIESFGAVVLTTIVQGTALNLVLLILMAVVYGVLRLIIGPAPAAGVCTRCGYDLRASGQVCPECGLIQDAALGAVGLADDRSRVA